MKISAVAAAYKAPSISLEQDGIHRGTAPSKAPSISLEQDGIHRGVSSSKAGPAAVVTLSAAAKAQLGTPGVQILDEAGSAQRVAPEEHNILKT